MFSFLKKKKKQVEETKPEPEFVQTTDTVNHVAFCPTCGSPHTKILGLTPEGLTVCENCGYMKADKNGVKRIYLKLSPDVVLTHKEDRE
jgi:hypothetical protein